MPAGCGRRGPILLLLATVLALAIPSSASALSFEIVNESGQPPSDVYVTVVGQPGSFDVPGMTNDVPVSLDTIPGQTLTINALISGRIYVSYGDGVTNSVPFDAQTRFDWAELTVTPSSSDVANLTAVDQFGIGMRLDTLDGSGDTLETLGSANSDTVFDALQQIPGGPQATVRDANGEILRVLSPNQSGAYPDLAEYVQSMSGQTITLHTAFYGTPFVTSVYSGTFGPDGSITLSGATNPPALAPTTLAFDGADIIDDVYDGQNTPNTLAGTVRRDLLAGFSTGLWGGKYGNDALGFCSNPITNVQGSWCPDGFNQPAFGDARTSLPPYPTCEQYAAVINQYADVYGNPYSDASKKVTVGLDQPGSGGDVATLRLTILPDTGDAQPSVSGNANCGAGPVPAPEPQPPVPPAPPAPPAPAPPTAPTAPNPAPSATGRGAAKPVTVRFHLPERAPVRRGAADLGRLRCSGPCGRIAVVARRGRRILGRTHFTTTRTTLPLKLRLDPAGRRLLHRFGHLRDEVVALVRPAGQRAVRRARTVTLKPAPARRHHPHRRDGRRRG
jgi:hypothetical protein